MNQIPIVIDIEIRKGSLTRSPPIAKKLQKLKERSERSPCIEDIQEKLRKAEELRKEEFAKKSNLLTDDKISKANERKINQEKDLLEKYQKDLEHKSEQADLLRKQAILNKIQIAKKQSSKVEQVLQKYEEMEKDKENKLREELEKKDEMATQKVKELNEQTILKVKTHIDKVHKVVESQKDRLAKELQEMKNDQEQKHFKAEQKREQILEKVKQTA
jgi:hypothetical protein